MTEQQLAAMRQALEALKYLAKPMAKGWDAETQLHKRDEAITALRQALEQQPAGEPDDLTIAYMAGLERGKDLARPQPAIVSRADETYEAAKQREWVGLTEEEIDKLYETHHNEYGYPLTLNGYERAIEAKLKEKNQ